MAASEPAIWIILLVGAVALCELLTRARVARVDPMATMVASALVAVACTSLATVYLSPAW
jgi:hypothetical protein